MITIYKDQIATLDVVIYRGSSRCLENFNRAKVEAFLYGMNSRVLMTHELGSDGVLHCDVPAGLSEGVYALEVVWIKNDLSRHNPSLGSRSVMRARKDELFAVTEFNNEVYPVPGSGTLVIRVEMQAGSYGYDGLDAYELAVMRGKTLLSEEEWLRTRGISGSEPDQVSVTLDNNGRLSVKVGRENDGTYVLQVGGQKFKLTGYGVPDVADYCDGGILQYGAVGEMGKTYLAYTETTTSTGKVNRLDSLGVRVGSVMTFSKCLEGKIYIADGNVYMFDGTECYVCGKGNASKAYVDETISKNAVDAVTQDENGVSFDNEDGDTLFEVLSANATRSGVLSAADKVKLDETFENHATKQNLSAEKSRAEAAETAIEGRVETIEDNMSVVVAKANTAESCSVSAASSASAAASHLSTVQEQIEELSASGSDAAAMVAKLAEETAAREQADEDIEDELHELGSYAANTEYKSVVVDSENRVLYGVNVQGEMVFGNKELNSLDNELGVPKLTIEKNSSVYHKASEEWAYLLLDSNDCILFGVKADGEVFYGVGLPQQIREAIGDIDLSNLQNVVTRSEFNTAIASLQTTINQIINDKISLSKLSTDVLNLIGANPNLAITNNPDGEDMESVTVSGVSVLKFKDRTVSDGGNGYKILRLGSSLSSQITTANTVYEVRYNFPEENLTMPDNCELKFAGGSLKGSITGSNTRITANPYSCIFNKCLLGSWDVDKIYPQWFGAKADGETNCTDSIQKAVDTVNSTNIKTVVFTGGDYLIDKYVEVKSPINISGADAHIVSSGIIGNDKTYPSSYYSNTGIYINWENEDYTDASDISINIKVHGVGLRIRKACNVNVHDCSIGTNTPGNAAEWQALQGQYSGSSSDNGPFWYAIQTIKSHHCTFKNVKIDQQALPSGINHGDGLHISSNCHDFVIDNLYGQCGDDFIALNVSEDGTGDIYNITIKNCTAGYDELNADGIRMYTDNANSNKIYNVFIDNCRIAASVTPCIYMSNSGNPTGNASSSVRLNVENIFISNCVLKQDKGGKVISINGTNGEKVSIHNSTLYSNNGTDSNSIGIFVASSPSSTMKVMSIKDCIISARTNISIPSSIGTTVVQNCYTTGGAIINN